MNVKMRKVSPSQRAKLRSPGRSPALHCAAGWPFWQVISRGLSSEDAASRCWGVHGNWSRVSRKCSDMPPSHLAPSAAQPTGHPVFGD